MFGSPPSATTWTAAAAPSTSSDAAGSGTPSPAPVLVSILGLGVRGLNAGIEFRGGSEFTVSNVATTTEIAEDAVAPRTRRRSRHVSVSAATSIRVETGKLTDQQTTRSRSALAKAYGVADTEITSISSGPAGAQDVTSKALTGLLVFLVLVSLVITLYFRTGRWRSRRIVALMHDLLITAGIYALVGFEVTPAPVIGLLTILGYSLYDTVVVFDKVRENTADITAQTG